MDYRTKGAATIENDLVLSAPTIILFKFNFSFIKARGSHVKSVTDLDLKDIREPGRNRASRVCLPKIPNAYRCDILPLQCFTRILRGCGIPRNPASIPGSRKGA